MASNIEASQEQLAKPPEPLETQRLPIVLETNMDAAAECCRRRAGGKLQVELENPLQGLTAMLIARINRGHAATRRSQRLARQFVLTGRHLANEPSGIGMRERRRRANRRLRSSSRS